MIVEQIEGLHRDEGLTYREACLRESVNYASFMRWRGRCGAGEEPVSRPGPQKVEPLDLDALREQVRTMRHGRRRTAGTGELYEQYRDRISRRDLNQVVREARDFKRRERDTIYHKVTWRMPRLIWALDDTEYQPDKNYPKAYLHNVQDLSSRYKFEPMVGLRLASGEEVAMNLERLFRTHGPPLFIKRDNHGNLNHHRIEEVLARFGVIPINSPFRTPRYNGGIEHAQGEIKSRLVERVGQPTAFLAIQAELDVQAINHSPRPCLHRRSSCEVFTAAADAGRVYTKRKRREVYDEIRTKMLELIETEDYDARMAWRLSVETWLLENGFITVSKKGKVLPSFPENRSHK